MKVEARLTFDKIRHDQDKTAHLVLSLTAPMKDGEEARPNLCVIPVIDVSGSMDGHKLEYAKRSALKLIDHLKPGDYCGLIAFESEAHVVISPTKITDGVKDKLKAEVGKLHTMGGTNFAAGMLKAIELVKKLDLPLGFIQRIIMLTDGCATEGPAVKGPDIIKLFNANAGRVTASAFGYGTDADQNFLGDFAKDGKGNYAFIQNPDGALAAFGKELGGLASTYATDLSIEISPLAGHEIERVITDVAAESEDVGGEVTVKIPNVLGEEERHLVFAVKLKEQKQAFPRAVNVFDVKFEYDIVDTNGKIEHKTGETKAKVHFVKAGEEDAKPNSLDKIVGLHEVIRAQLEAEEQAKKGNFVGAQRVMKTAALHLGGRGLSAAASAADGISHRLASATSYSTNQGYLRSFSGGGTRGTSLSAGDGEALAHLQSYGGVQFENSTQTASSNAFTGVVGGIVAPDPQIQAAPLINGGFTGVAGGVDWTSALAPGSVVHTTTTLGGGLGGLNIGGLGGLGSSANPLLVADAGLWAGSPVGVVGVIANNGPVEEPVGEDEELKAAAKPVHKVTKKPASKKIKQSKSSTRW